jgi:hypothetical protein
VLPLLSGCLAQRELVVTSEPPGAEVRIDEEYKGRTPLTLPFTHYGKRRVSLYLEGHIASSEVVSLSPPWYGRFPLDIFSEVLIPVGWHQTVRHHVELEPGTGKIPAPELNLVLERAESLRRHSASGRVEPPR